MTTLTAHPDTAATDPDRDVDPVGAAGPASAVQDVLDAEVWTTRPADMWTRVERDRALARFTHLKVLVTEHGCVVARTPVAAAPVAGAERERWPPSPAAA